MSKRDRRAEIMQAAEKLFTNGRFEEITLDEVVRCAGVGKGTIYRYFVDKDDLFFQTAMNGLEELCQVLQASAAERASFPDQLLDACRQISSFFHRRRPLFSMMQGQECRMETCGVSRRKQWETRRRQLVASLAVVLARGTSEGKVRGDISAEVQAAFLLGLLRTRARDAELAELPNSLDMAVELFLQGAARNGHAPQRTETGIEAVAEGAAQ